jgi:hypothetical protein
VCAGAELYYFEREPVIVFWRELEIEARAVLPIDYEEPDAFGIPIELPMLTSLYQNDRASVLDLSGRHEHPHQDGKQQFFICGKPADFFVENMVGGARNFLSRVQWLIARTTRAGLSTSPSSLAPSPTPRARIWQGK